MSSLLKFLLIGHVFLGLAGVILFYAVLMILFKPLDLKKIRRIRFASFFGLLSFLLSWISGGYYYVVHYGSGVKPLIKAGNYPWAHSVFMETKEHIFLIMPFLAAVICLCVCLLKEEEIEINRGLKKSLIFLAAVLTILGVFAALSGILISGAVK